MTEDRDFAPGVIIKGPQTVVVTPEDGVIIPIPHGPREADSGWRENDDYRRTHEALSPEARRAMGFSGEGADASTRS